MSGLYIHVPFCHTKCPYCDFYSVKFTSDICEKYVTTLIDQIKDTPYIFETVYIGGGTPNTIGAKNLVRILDSVRNKLAPMAEVTTELNPTYVDFEFFEILKDGGFNRISMGLQSSNKDELTALGRSHGKEDVVTAVTAAKAAGFTNISLDLMLGVPNSTPEKLIKSINFCVDLAVTHISCYILKIEERTPFFDIKDTLVLPDEDEICDMYLLLVNEMAKHGFKQYEISNFALTDFESRHNLKYWRDEEYLGVGPAAHSYLFDSGESFGKRYYYPRDINYFLNGGEPIFDSLGGDFSEYAMLRLRLIEGLNRVECAKKFDESLFYNMLAKAKRLPEKLVVISNDNIHFTPEGFLVSNMLIAKLL